MHNTMRMRRARPPTHLYKPSTMALTTNRPFLPIYPPVATKGDISARLAPVLSSLAEPRRADTRSDDQEAMDAYFHGVYDRLLPIKTVLDDYSHRVPLQMKSEESSTMRAFLVTGLPACYHELRRIYRPFLVSIARDEFINTSSHSGSVSEGALGSSGQLENMSYTIGSSI